LKESIEETPQEAPKRKKTFALPSFKETKKGEKPAWVVSLKTALVSSKAVAFLLALAVGTTTATFVALTDSPKLGVWVSGFISFASTFLLSYVTLEFLIFKEINNLYQKLSKIKKKDFISTPSTDEESDYKRSANPLRRFNQEIMEYAGQKQREIENLKRLEAFRREFIADVSHELKTPIFASQGFILTLLDGAVEDEKVRYTFLKKAAKSIESLSLLVEDLLTLSQIESGDIKMRCSFFDIATLTQDIFEELEPKAEKRQVRLLLENTSDAEGYQVYADRHRIKQVLVNLIVNAIKYGNEGGTVRVGFKRTKKHIKISVKDDGQGIAPEHLKRIFERFYRVEKSRSRQEGGTGLGLAIVKHILERHGSRINVRSVLGEGTTFSFKLAKAENVVLEGGEDE
jgi:two-component system phosphate regulon sensor histidine kinase PhoR